MNTEELIKNDTVIKKLADKNEIGWINKKEIPYSEYEKNLPLSDDGGAPEPCVPDSHSVVQHHNRQHRLG